VRPPAGELSGRNGEGAARPLHRARGRLELADRRRLGRIACGDPVFGERQGPERLDAARVEEPRPTCRGAGIEGDHLATVTRRGDDLLDVVDDLCEAVRRERRGDVRGIDTATRCAVARKQDRKLPYGKRKGNLISRLD
jgi:hypothetical protein